MSNAAVEKAAPAGVPALATTPALDIDSSDIVLPRIRIGHPQADQVAEGLVNAGDLYATQGADDPNPVRLYEAETKDGLLLHVLGLRKGKSIQDENNELVTWDFHDPDAPADARVTYDYAVALPEHDTDVPYKFMLKGASTGAAKLINTILKRNEGRGPASSLAFRVTTAPRSTTKGKKTFKYHVAQVRQVEADPANVALAEGLASIVAGSSIEQTSSAPADQPKI